MSSWLQYYYDASPVKPAPKKTLQSTRHIVIPTYLWPLLRFLERFLKDLGTKARPKLHSIHSM